MENRREYLDFEGVASPSSSSHGGVGLDFFHCYAGLSAKLEKQGFMTVVKLTVCRVPMKPVFPVPVGGYVVSFVAFYERFLQLLLWYYGLELHHLTP
jgi:hypothetical protein